MMNTRRVDGLLNVHAVIDHIGDYIEHGIDNCRPAGTADSEPETAVFEPAIQRCRMRNAGAQQPRFALAHAHKPVVMRRRETRAVRCKCDVCNGKLRGFNDL
jgi:hypothetical protein